MLSNAGKTSKGSQMALKGLSHKMLEEWAYSESNDRGCPGIGNIFCVL